jgi:hypothetical protein
MDNTQFYFYSVNKYLTFALVSYIVTLYNHRTILLKKQYYSLMKYNFFGLLLICITFSMSSCSKDDTPELSTSTRILTFKLVYPGEREGSIDYASKKIAFSSYQPYTDVTSVIVSITVSNGASVSPASGSEVDFSNGPVKFTVTNGTNTSEYLVTVVVDPPSRIAFIGDYTLASQITEPDTRAAYDFLKKYYGTDLIYIAFKNINEFTLEYVDVIYYYENPDTLLKEIALIPSIGKATSTVKALKKWYDEDGGHFVFAGQGAAYMQYLDRLPFSDMYDDTINPFRPKLFNTKPGDWSQEQGGINFNLNPLEIQTNTQKQWNNNGNRLFFSMYKDSTKQVVPPLSYYSYNYFPTQSYGWKENHYLMWDIAGLGVVSGYNGLNNFQKAEKFESDAICKILGNNVNVTDLSSASFIEFFPRNTNEGTVIAIGDPAYDWSQVKPTDAVKPDWYTGEFFINAHIENVGNWTVNCINYLLSK